jgi:prepilin-type N-terminal cleavage/methylation domain-containing protein
MTRQCDEGFTLVEMLVAMAISATIVPVLTGAIVIGWRTTDDTIVQLGQTHSRQILGSALAVDVTNATSLSMSATACTQGSDSVLAVFRWEAPKDDGSTAAHEVAWVTLGTAVQRRDCDPGSSTYSELVTARDVVTARAECPATLTDDWTGAPCTPTSRFVRLKITDDAGTFYAAGRRRQVAP